MEREDMSWPRSGTVWCVSQITYGKRVIASPTHSSCRKQSTMIHGEDLDVDIEEMYSDLHIAQLSNRSRYRELSRRRPTTSEKRY